MSPKIIAWGNKRQQTIMVDGKPYVFLPREEYNN